MAARPSLRSARRGLIAIAPGRDVASRDHGNEREQEHTAPNEMGSVRLMPKSMPPSGAAIADSQNRIARQMPPDAPAR
jgi:hypothetical protein